MELLGSRFPGDKVDGVDEFVEKLAKALRMRFPDRAQRPRVVYVDRGEGFYKSNGKITDEFAAALERHGLKAFHGAMRSTSLGGAATSVCMRRPSLG